MQDLPPLLVGSSLESRALVVVCGRCVAHPTSLFLLLTLMGQLTQQEPSLASRTYDL